MKVYRSLVAGLICVGVWGAVSDVQAQDATATAKPPINGTKTTHKQNLQLEHVVRKALDKQKIDTSDIRVTARSESVGLEGTVPDASQISLAGTVAQSVVGTRTVKNNLTLREEGH
jgi:hyperosmotically inducible periplasmic protein